MTTTGQYFEFCWFVRVEKLWSLGFRQCLLMVLVCKLHPTCVSLSVSCSRRGCVWWWDFHNLFLTAVWRLRRTAGGNKKAMNICSCFIYKKHMASTGRVYVDGKPPLLCQECQETYINRHPSNLKTIWNVMVKYFWENLSLLWIKKKRCGCIWRKQANAKYCFNC